MTYELGIDLGTTWTAAAVWRGERATIVNLGTRQAAVPSIVYVGPDGSVLIGEAADRRVLSEPERVARQFKRRIGDPAPILLGGAPHSAELLTAKLLRWVVDAVANREGEMPTTITITHPANWGAYKKDLLEQAVHLAGLSGPGNPTIRLLSEPEAAAIHYAGTERVEPGQAVAVYDLGGGTFDVAVLRSTGDSFAILGAPEGIERLGGIDFDAAVLGHVARTLGGLDDLDPDDPAVATAVAHLRDQCTAAKEALSVDTQTIVPVLLPGRHTEVRLTARRARGDAAAGDRGDGRRDHSSAAHRGSAALRPQGGRARRRFEPHPPRRAARDVGARSTGRARHRPEACDRARRGTSRAPHRGRAGRAHLAQPPDSPRAVGGAGRAAARRRRAHVRQCHRHLRAWPDPSAGAPADRIDRPTADEWAHPDGAAARDLGFVDPAAGVLYTAALRAAVERPDDTERSRHSRAARSASGRDCSSALRLR